LQHRPEALRCSVGLPYGVGIGLREERQDGLLQDEVRQKEELRSQEGVRREEGLWRKKEIVKARS